MRERRRGVNIFICYAFGIAMGYGLAECGVKASLLAMLLLPAGFYRMFGKKALLFILLGLALFMASWQAGDGLDLYEGTTELKKEAGPSQVSIQARVLDLNKHDRNMIVGLENNRCFRNKLLVKYKKDFEPSSLCGRRVSLSGCLQRPQASVNPRCFNYSFYLKRKGIDHILTLNSLEFLEEDSWPGRLKFKAINCLQTAKEDFYKALVEGIGKRKAGIVIAMVYGQKQYLDEDDYRLFQKNGLAHVMAASGLHVGVLYILLVFVFGRPRGVLSLIGTGAVLFVYAAFVGFSPSIIRAVIMISISLVGRLKCRRYDLETALAIAGLIILLFRPLDLFDLAFQMSVLCVLAICRIQRLSLFLGANKFLTNTFVLPVAIQVFLLPFTAYVFNYISLAGFLVNILFLGLAGLILQLSMLVAIFSLFALKTPFLISGLGNLLGFFIRANQLIFSGGRFVFDVKSPSPVFVFLFYSILILATSDEFIVCLLRKNWKYMGRTIALVSCTALFLASMQGGSFKQADIVFWDVGQGNAIMFQTGSGKLVLVDGGGSSRYDVGEKSLKPALLKNGFSKIDLAIVTHLDEDHFKAVASLAKQGLVEKMIVSTACKPQTSYILEKPDLKQIN